MSTPAERPAQILKYQPVPGAFSSSAIHGLAFITLGVPLAPLARYALRSSPSVGPTACDNVVGRDSTSAKSCCEAVLFSKTKHPAQAGFFVLRSSICDATPTQKNQTHHEHSYSKDCTDSEVSIHPWRAVQSAALCHWHNGPPSPSVGPAPCELAHPPCLAMKQSCSTKKPTQLSGLFWFYGQKTGCRLLPHSET